MLQTLAKSIKANLAHSEDHDVLISLYSTIFIDAYEMAPKAIQGRIAQIHRSADNRSRFARQNGYDGKKSNTMAKLYCLGQLANLLARVGDAPDE